MKAKAAAAISGYPDLRNEELLYDRIDRSRRTHGTHAEAIEIILAEDQLPAGLEVTAPGRDEPAEVELRGEVIVRSVVTATLWLVLVPLAGCATTHDRMISAADRLERNADAFDSDTRYEPGSTHSATGDFRGAREFVEQAHDFRQTVDSAGDQEVIFAFEHLWRSYHALRDQVDRLRSRQARADLKSVTEAFVDVQRIVKNGYSYADNALYSSGGYQFDPYYN